MKEDDLCVKRFIRTPSLLEVHLMDDTIHRFPMKDIFDYTNQKPSSMIALEKLNRWLDKDPWFSGKNNKPTLRNLAEKYTRIMKTDLDCPITVFRVNVMPEGENAPHDGWALLDGTHRLAKCLITGKNSVRVAVVTTGELFLHIAEID